MSDVNSGLPVRSQLPGQTNYDDVIVKVADGAVDSQLLGVDTSGRVTVKLDDAAGNGITSQTNGAQQALDVISQSNGPVSPGTVANYSDLIGGQYNSTLPTLTTGQQAAVQVDSRGRLLVVTLTTDDHNYGVVGANTLRTAAQIGNATGAADFNFGTVGAQTLRVAGQIGNATGAADFNAGATGAQTLRVTANQGTPGTAANAWFIKVTDGTNTQTVTAGGEALVRATNFPNTVDTNYGVVGANTIRTAAQIGNATGQADFNYGVVGAQTLRVASELGNAAGSIDYNSGAPTAQTIRVAADIFDASGNPFSLTNPLPVVVTDATPGTPVNDYKRAVAIAAGASDNHDYTVTAGKTLFLNQIESTGSGKAKMQLDIETGVATGVFTTRWSQFNSTADPNMTLHIDNPIAVAAGVRVRVVMTNKDLLAADMYSTISGYELP